MSRFSTTYLGFELQNPIIVGASPLTLDEEAVAKCAAAGAGAVVLKSLFEEQIRLDSATLDQSLAAAGNWHSEVFAYMEADIGVRYGTREYLQIIRQCKRSVDIPVIASINCIGAEWWQDFAGEAAASGADGLELNVSLIPTPDATSEALETEYVEIVRAARAAVDIPIAVKLGPFITALPRLVERLVEAGADGLVLFNRFYRPTIDIERLRVTAGERLSSSAENSLPLRWISLLADTVDADLAAATGVHTGEDLIRMLLAGANAVQVVSALCQRHLEHIGTLLEELGEWMDRRGYETVAEVRGLMSQAANPDAELFGRCQYIKGLVGIE